MSNLSCRGQRSRQKVRGLTWRLLPGLLALTMAPGCGDRSKETQGTTSGPGKGGAGDASVETSARFVEVAEASGVKFMYRDGQESGNFAIVESLGGGAALLDYDADGALDIFLPGGGKYGEGKVITGLPGALFRNGGNRSFFNVTQSAGVGEAPRYSHGTAVADYDNDGFPDLLVTGYGGLQLFRNHGDGTFEECAQLVGLSDMLWSSSAGWGDLNGDGVLDLFVAHYVNWSFDNDPYCSATAGDQRDVCPPRKYEGLPDTLYYGIGDGTFRDASAEAGLMPVGKPPEVSMFDCDKGLGVLLADFDLDGLLDFYVANDTVPNYLYRNLGSGRFEEIGGRSGTALSETATPDGSMGVDIGDFNGDGLPDLWVVNYERESMAMYRNEGDCQFLHVSRSIGVTAVGSLFVSFGTAFLDFDRDGDEDLFVSNGHVIRYPINAPLLQVPVLFENRGGRLVNVASGAGPYLSTPHLGRGVAAGDIDNDGDIDLVLSPINEPAAILINESPDRNHWLQVRLIGVASQRDAVGAHVTLVTSAGQQTRQVKGGGSYLSQSDLRCFFGIPGEATFEKLSIRWPSGLVQEFSNLALDRTFVAVETRDDSK